ncbi:MAG: hypothetical protein QNK37_01860 [Acidobacteriota bacterium]|nr:hypothetical protein [Acidobacteriota bacterium]
MNRSLLTLLIAGVLLATVACGKKEDKVDFAAGLAALKTTQTELNAKRAEAVGLEGEAATAAYKELGDAGTEFMDQIANFIYEIDLQVSKTKEPLPPEYQQATRMISDEYLIIGKEYIDRQGDYNYAISVYEEGLKSDPDYQALKDAKAEAERLRYMTADRFAAAKEGMTEAEVKAAIGPVYSQGIQTYPEKKSKAWFYKREDGGTAGVFFQEKDGVYKVYKVDYDAVKPGA